MAKPVTLKVGQFLLLVASLCLIGAAAGVLGAGLYWHVHGFATLAAPLEILGGVAFVVLATWKTLDDWVERTGNAPPRRP
jgi:hypothetical protein